MENLQKEELLIEASLKDEALVLVWRGAIHSASPDEYLNPYLDSMLEEARQKKLRLVCDFQNLEYMNSASIPPLIQLLRHLAEQQVHGEFVYNKNRKVQSASFKALDVIARKSDYTSVSGVA